jgi:hypothetical protein
LPEFVSCHIQTFQQSDNEKVTSTYRHLLSFLHPCVYNRLKIS